MRALVPGPFSLSFYLGRIPVVIQPTFWLMAIFMGLSLPRDQTVIWVAVVLVSILVHELGHALAYKAFGASSGIELYAFGGLCYGERDVGRWQGIVVSLAGPGAGFVLGGVAVLVGQLWVSPPEPVHVALWQLKWVNFFWGFMNLLPVLPLDGGRVLENLLGPRRARALPLVCGVTGALVALTAGYFERTYMALLFGFLAWRNLSAWHAARPKVPPQASPQENEARIKEGWTALHAGRELEAARLGKRVLDESRRPPERAAALDLLAWASLAQGQATHALSWLKQTTPPDLARPLSWALAHEAAGQFADAAAHAQRALQQEPSDVAAGLAVRTLLASGEVQRAEEWVTGYAWKSPDAAAEARQQVDAVTAAPPPAQPRRA